MVDFYSELFKSICEEDEPEDIAPKCLITKENLADSSITLECNHAFNYEPLFKEVQKQKSCMNHLSNIKSSEHKHAFKYTQLMCPYCRNIEDTLLPYRDSMNMPKIVGVNWPKPVCGYVFVAGKNVNRTCGKPIYSTKAYCMMKR